MTWQEDVQLKKAGQLDAIPVEWRIPSSVFPADDVKNVIDFSKTSGILTAQEVDIVYSDETLVIRRLASGYLSALDVMTAFCKAAAVAHQLTNCLTEIFFERALVRARELDDLYAKNGNRPIGPLHGCPISLKDQFQIKGTECNMGIVSWIGDISEKDSTLVTILEDAGAIIHCRTNVSQALMFAETDNYVYGQSCNPYNRTLTCGGSSGGEGALVALRGSLFGVGTDSGGSVRIPASYQGLWGLKPSMNRFPYAGARNSCLGLESIASCLGPISRSLTGISVFAKTVIDAQPWLMDPKVPEIPWHEDMLQLKDASGAARRPVFGLMRWDGVVMPHPPVCRALDMAVKALRSRGFEVVDFEPLECEKAASIAARIYGSDGGEDLRRTFAKSGEPHHPLIVKYQVQTQMSVYESWQLTREKDAYQQAFLEHWNATRYRTSSGQPIDGLLLPSGPTTAYRLGEWQGYLGYTTLFNLLDLPAMIIPLNSTIDPLLDPVDSSYTPVNERDRRNHASYSPEAFYGAPLTVQLAGRRFREEEVIGLSGLVSNALEG